MKDLGLQRIFANGRCLPLWIFSMALVIRALPEFLSGPYPVGYDPLAWRRRKWRFTWVKTF